jgi:hypothetical protein
VSKQNKQQDYYGYDGQAERLLAAGIHGHSL